VANKIVKNTFETIEGIAKGMGQDATQSLTGQYPSPKPQATLPTEQKTDIKTDEQKNLQIARQNIAKINQQIVEARKKRENRVVTEEKKQVQEKQEQKFEAKKKESVLMKLIKSQKGTKEGLPKASG